MDEGKRGAALALKQMGDLASTCRPASSGSRLPRWASASWASRPSRSLAEEALGEALPHGVTLAISFGFAYLITTSLHITLGEQVPKIFAIVHAEDVRAGSPAASSSSGWSSSRSS